MLQELLLMSEKFDNLYNSLRLPHIQFLTGVTAFFVLLLGLTYFDASNFYKGILLLVYVSACWMGARKNIAYVLYFLIIWFAFENLILKYIVPDLVVYIKYLPEVTLYLVCLFLAIQKSAYGELKLIKTPINFAFLGIIFIALLSAIMNGVGAMTMILGIRQMIRFMLVFFLIVYAGISKKDVQNIILLLLGITGVQIILALGQFFSRGALDAYLLPDQGFFIGDSIVIEGVEQYWAAGQRVFGTFRRYNELGAFLTLIVSIVAAYAYHYRGKAKKLKDAAFSRLGIVTKNKFVFYGSILLLIATVILTYSRSTWIAALCATFVIAVLIKRNKRFIKWGSIIVIIGAIYVATFLLGSQLRLEIISDQKSANLAERILEPFSATALRGSYDGFGRIYFWVNTPKVVAQSPFIGVGPGMYGGGVAAALNNKKVYDENGIAFGVYGETGQIDNNWLSIWGELGTIGLLLFIMLFGRLYIGARALYNNHKDIFVQTLALALQGAVVAAVVLGLFAPYFEIRTFGFYFWLLAGCTYALGLQKTIRKKRI